MNPADPHARIHATLVALPREDGSEAGVLLLGEPGAGKSDIALRLIDNDGMLVADDQVELAIADGALCRARRLCHLPTASNRSGDTVFCVRSAEPPTSDSRRELASRTTRTVRRSMGGGPR